MIRNSTGGSARRPAASAAAIVPHRQQSHIFSWEILVVNQLAKTGIFAGTAVLAIVRAGAVRVPWGRLALDGLILALGFGAFFWFFVIRPSSVASNEPDFIRHVLAQSYIVLSCLMVLTFGVFLMNVGTGPLARRTLMLMTIGF